MTALRRGACNSTYMLLEVGALDNNIIAKRNYAFLQVHKRISLPKPILLSTFHKD